MSLLIADEARVVVDGADGDPASRTSHRRSVELLEREIGSPRRLGLGVLALVAIGAGGVFLAVAVDAVGDDPGLVAVGVVLAAVFGAPGVVLGAALARTGDRIVRAHAVWTAEDAFAPPGPTSIVQRLVSGRSLLRSALAAAALIVAVFSWTFVGLGVAPSDPLDAGSSQAMLVVLGLVWAAASTAATCYLVSGEIRMGRAHAAAVIRDR